MDNVDSFSKMVSGLSDDERRSILEKLKSSPQQSSDITILPAEKKIAEIPDDAPFEIRIKKESLLLRFFIWLKSLITNTSSECIYNELKIAKLSRLLDKNFPGLIDSKKGLLLSPLYDKFLELKACADFFRPYILSVEDSEGAFYVFLGSLTMPEMTADMDAQIDPRTASPTADAKPEVRIQLLHKMDDIFDSANKDERARMYNAVKSLEWLRQFVRLPFTRVLARFTQVAENTRTAPFAQLSEEIGKFCTLLSTEFIFSDELLESLFMFSLKKSRLGKYEDSSNKAGDFVIQAKSNTSLIGMFQTSVPLRSISCIVNNNPYWRAENFSGGEGWFVTYKNSWKKLFEQKWADWEQECHKEQLRKNMCSQFNLSSFPLLPERPWTTIWGGLPFRYELTAGFINWFIREQFPQYEMHLKTVLTEGVFNKIENHAMLSEAFNSFVQLSISFHELERRLSASGEAGMILNKLNEEPIRTLQAQTKAEQIIQSAESDTISLIRRFGDACRESALVLSGILGTTKDIHYDTVSNLNHLNANNGNTLIEKLEASFTGLTNALEMVKNLENIDNQNANKKD